MVFLIQREEIQTIAGFLQEVVWATMCTRCCQPEPAVFVVSRTIPKRPVLQPGVGQVDTFFAVV